MDKTFSPKPSKGYSFNIANNILNITHLYKSIYVCLYFAVSRDRKYFPRIVFERSYPIQVNSCFTVDKAESRWQAEMVANGNKSCRRSWMCIFRMIIKGSWRISLWSACWQNHYRRESPPYNEERETYTVKRKKMVQLVKEKNQRNKKKVKSEIGKTGKRKCSHHQVF